jgi:hypothetical protein
MASFFKPELKPVQKPLHPKQDLHSKNKKRPFLIVMTEHLCLAACEFMKIFFLHRNKLEVA